MGMDQSFFQTLLFPELCKFVSAIETVILNTENAICLGLQLKFEVSEHTERLRLNLNEIQRFHHDFAISLVS